MGCAGRVEEWGRQCSPPLTIFCVVLLVPVILGGLQPHPHVGFHSGVLSVDGCEVVDL